MWRQFYYDRAAATISYIARPGETANTLEATATTATQQELLLVNGSANVRWEGVRFEYATWLGASGPKGYVDTQSAYLCQDGEPPVNVHVWHSKNVTFSGCDFQHLGAVYAIGELHETFLGSRPGCVAQMVSEIFVRLRRRA